MVDNNWFIIDGFLFGDVEPIKKILKTFLESYKKRILFKYYVFDLDDCDKFEDYSKEEYINEEFEYFKIKFVESVDYDKIANEVINMLYREYCKLFKIFNDEIDFFEEEFIYSIKEFIARETSKRSKESLEFINERKVLENNINISFTANRPSIQKSYGKLNYVWYEPTSQEDLFNILEENRDSFSCIITEDVDNFDQYLYAIELFEGRDFLLAINDRVGDFNSRILPKVQGFLSKENVVLSEEEYFEGLMRDYINDSDVDYQ